jgi:hypothetical protein
VPAYSPIIYISPPIAFDKAGIVAESNMIGCNGGIYTANVLVTNAANYRQQVYLYARLPQTEAAQPRPLIGSPFDLDVLPQAVAWPATSIICGCAQASSSLMQCLCALKPDQRVRVMWLRARQGASMAQFVR